MDRGSPVPAERFRDDEDAYPRGVDSYRSGVLQLLNACLMPPPFKPLY